MSDTVIYGDALEMDAAKFRKYKIIIADPPWYYNARSKYRLDNGSKTRGIGAGMHYDLMRNEDIADMPVFEIADKRCLLFLWATAPLLDKAIDTMRAWGFKYCTVAFVWIKTNPKRWSNSMSGQMRITSNAEGFMNWMTAFLPGYYTGSNAEFVLLGRRGTKSFEHARGHKVSQVVYAPRGEHSEKPEAVQDKIEYMYPEVLPRLEMFARRKRSGWDIFGNEVKS